MISIVETRITSPAVKELIEEIKKFNGPLEKMRDESRMKKLLSTTLHFLAGALKTTPKK